MESEISCVDCLLECATMTSRRTGRIAKYWRRQTSYYVRRHPGTRKRGGRLFSVLFTQASKKRSGGGETGGLMIRCSIELCLTTRGGSSAGPTQT